MNDFESALAGVAARAERPMAARVETSDVETARARIQRGRRARNAGIGGALLATAGVVAAIVVALPLGDEERGRQLDPGSTTPIAQPTPTVTPAAVEPTLLPDDVIPVDPDPEPEPLPQGPELSGLPDARPLTDIQSGAGLRPTAALCEQVIQAANLSGVKLVPGEVPGDRPEWIFGAVKNGARDFAWSWTGEATGPWFASTGAATIIFLAEDGRVASVARPAGQPSPGGVGVQQTFTGQVQCPIQRGAPLEPGTYRVVGVFEGAIPVAGGGVAPASGVESWVDLGEVVVPE